MMKKFAILLVAMLCTTTAFAQFETDYGRVVNNAKNPSSWEVGLRLGDTGLQAVADFAYNDDCYFEARFGMLYSSRMYFTLAGWDLGYVGGVCADFTALHYWKCYTWDWTPRAGTWFLDAGAGLNIGGAKNYMYLGVSGSAKFGFEFREVPIRLSVDYTPVLGPSIAYGMKKHGFEKGAYSDFFWSGLYNFGVTATYYF